MKKITINHTCVEQKWHKQKENTDLLLNAETLVLGSFNPHNPNGNNADFYYGRYSNFLWKVIAVLTNKDEQFYCNRLDRKIEAMQEYSFCFLDLISSIEVSTNTTDESITDHFLDQKIFSGYSDNVLFTTQTTFQNQKVQVKRNYNEEIGPILKNGKFKRVIHTLGNTTINQDLKTKPLEKNRKDSGFQGYWNKVIASSNTTTFIRESYSPSAYAIRKLGGENYNQLTKWIGSNLLNNIDKQ
jgi:hypothetical protein